MKPQKFLQSYKCDCFQPDDFCNCRHKKVASDVLIENITDTAESLIEIMLLCGIKDVKTKAVLEVVTYYFLNFEEILHRIDSVPSKHFKQEDLMHDLGRRCGMNRREAQMSFSIIKRAFKAFYHGTGEGGVPSRFKDKLTHSSECLWAHAAQRTAEVCACYEGMFYVTQKDLECKIKLVYKQLHDRIVASAPRCEDNECMCETCAKRIKKETLNPKPSTCDFHSKTDPYEVLFLREQEKLTDEAAAENYHYKSTKTAYKEKKTCPCPSLSMTEKDYTYGRAAESLQIGTAREPFECRWMPISRFEGHDSSLNTKLPEEFSCYPYQAYEECDSQSECACEDCTCETDADSDVGRDIET